MYSLVSLFIGILLLILGSFRIVPFINWWFVYVGGIIIGLGLGVTAYKKEQKGFAIIPITIHIGLALFIIVGTVFMNVFGGRP